MHPKQQSPHAPRGLARAVGEDAVVLLPKLVFIKPLPNRAFFDMQDKSRIKALKGCIAVLNGEVNQAFGNNILLNGFSGKYAGYAGSGDPDFIITGQFADSPGSGTIKHKKYSDTYELTWTAGPNTGPDNNKKPGYFKLGDKI